MKVGSQEMVERARAGIDRAQEEKKAEIQKFIRENKDHLTNYFRGIPNSMQWGWLSNYMGKSTPMKAIRAKCYDCSGYDRNEAQTCHIRTCPLWHYRPKSKKQEKVDE